MEGSTCGWGPETDIEGQIERFVRTLLALVCLAGGPTLTTLKKPSALRCCWIVVAKTGVDDGMTLRGLERLTRGWQLDYPHTPHARPDYLAGNADVDSD
jgi:hypothetical protein